ncbi:MAG: MoaD/ThiS family protein [Actinomycetota bacterium]
MSVVVKIPTQLRDLVGGKSEIEVADVATIREMFEKLGADHPALVERIIDESGELRRFVNVYVGDEDVRFLEGLETAAEGPVTILPAVAGGGC